MEPIITIRDLIALWPRRAALVEDMNAVLRDRPVTKSQVDKWVENGSIPAKYHFQILQAARLQGFAVTADLIIRLHAGSEAA